MMFEWIRRVARELRNDAWIVDRLRECSDVLCAWGQHHTRHDWRKERVAQVLSIIRRENVPMWTLGQPLRDGSPRHPLYLKAATPLVRWQERP